MKRKITLGFLSDPEAAPNEKEEQKKEESVKEVKGKDETITVHSAIEKEGKSENLPQPGPQEVVTNNPVPVVQGENLPNLPSLLESIPDEEVKVPIFYQKSTPVTSDQSWSSFLYWVAQLLMALGVHINNIRTGIVTFLVLSAAALKYPLGLEIVDEESGAVNLVHACSKLIPDSWKLELSKISLDFLTRERANLPGRAMIGFNPEGFRKDSLLLNEFLERQAILRQETVQIRYGSVFQEIELRGPTSAVLINNDAVKRILLHPSFIHLHMMEGVGHDSFSEQKDGRDLYLAWMKANLERLSDRPVEIPFSNAIRDHLNASKVQDAQQKCDTLLKILKVITIINNPPILSTKEVAARLLNVPDLRGKDHQSGPLVSSKVDYYYLWTVMDGLWESRSNSLNDREKRIFEVIKKENLKNVKTSTFTPGNDATETLLTISASDNSWIPQDHIIKLVNKDGGEEIGISMCYRELMSLVKKEVIRTKTVKETNKKIYAISVFDVRENIRLPHPSSIVDPTLGNSKIKVVNPITGVVEEI